MVIYVKILKPCINNLTKQISILLVTCSSESCSHLEKSMNVSHSDGSWSTLLRSLLEIIEFKINMAYFGHSNACWNIHGKSYAELASTAPSSSQATSDISPNYGAGTPSGLRPRGAGSFLAQVRVAGSMGAEYHLVQGALVCNLQLNLPNHDIQNMAVPVCPHVV